MDNQFLIDSFFKPLKLESTVSDVDYIKIKNQIEALSLLSNIANMSFYMIDYQKKGFIYVSTNPLFLCGYDREDVLKMGYDFYPKILSSKDLSMLLEINQKGFEYFYSQPLEIRQNLYISYDFKIHHKDGQQFMVNQKLIPFALTKDGDMWLSLCLVTLSVNENSGNVYIQQINSTERLEYSFNSKRWKKSETIKLTDTELKILRLSAQGHTIKTIADTMHIDDSTVKFHKTNIFKKFNVYNIAEAIYFASINNLI